MIQSRFRLAEDAFFLVHEAGHTVVTDGHGTVRHRWSAHFSSPSLKIARLVPKRVAVGWGVPICSVAVTDGSHSGQVVIRATSYATSFQLPAAGSGSSSATGFQLPASSFQLSGSVSTCLRIKDGRSSHDASKAKLGLAAGSAGSWKQVALATSSRTRPSSRERDVERDAELETRNWH